MRTLKFRAWHKPKKKMLYVGNAFMPDLTASGCPVDPYENRRNLSMIFELMQYSGLKDKEGKEIYEGDIMQGSVTSPKYRVTMDCGRWCANYTHKGNSGALQLYFRQDMFEIIGNIYENGGLLK